MNNAASDYVNRSDELKAAVLANQAKAGTMVVLDPRTGEILAMVSQPAFNPNNREGISPGMTRNRAVIDLFEPGSTLKPFVVATALEQGLFKPTSVIDTNPGWFTVQGNSIRDLHNYGVLDLGGILAKSSNVGASRIALAMPAERLWSVLRDYGFRLEETPKGLRRRRGLLTRTDTVMPIHRVQALKVTTRIFRRRFGWHARS